MQGANGVPARRRGYATIGALCVAVLVLAGCEKEEAPARLSRGNAPSSTEKANLPPSPKFEEKQAVTRYNDGSYSVDGLLRQGQASFGQKVTVKGYVIEKRLCDPEDPQCRRPPHALIADTPTEKQRTLLVVGYITEDVESVDDLKLGEAVVLTGTFDQVSSDGRFIRATGLLIRDRTATPTAPAPPSGATGTPAAPAADAPAPAATPAAPAPAPGN